VPFVRGEDVARRARVVVSNGGSTTGYQALSQGTPVIGLPSNFDQYLATEAIVAAGAGVLVKARQATPELIRGALVRALADIEMQAAARRIAERFASQDAGVTFRDVVNEVLEAGAPRPRPALRARSNGS
jgi:UDP:flavonoid glycosyltransferase YjiC (YdhE family)